MKNIYTFVIVISPILSVYGANGISFMDITLIMLALILGFNDLKTKTIKINKNLTSFFLFVVITYCITLMYSDIHVINFLGTARYLLYLAVVIFFSSRYFDYKKAIYFLKISSISISAFVLLQFFAYYLVGIVVPNVISFLPISSSEMVHNLSQIDYVSKSYIIFRPTGPFLEPAHCAQFLAIFATYRAINNNTKKEMFELVLVILALLLTGSSTAYIISAVILVIVFIRKITIVNNIKTIVITIFGMVLVSSIIYYMFNNNDFFINTFERLIGDSTSSGAAVTGRRGNVEYFYQDFFSNNIIYILFGNNVGSEQYYLPAIPLMVNNVGIIGISIYFFTFFKKFIYSDLSKKMIIVVYWILAYGTAIFFGPISIIYNAFIFCVVEREDNI